MVMTLAEFSVTHCSRAVFDVLPIVSGRETGGSVDENTAFKQTPHVRRGSYLLDYHFRVDVAVIQKVDVNFLDFGDAFL